MLRFPLSTRGSQKQALFPLFYELDCLFSAILSLRRIRKVCCSTWKSLLFAVVKLSCFRLPFVEKIFGNSCKQFTRQKFSDNSLANFSFLSSKAEDILRALIHSKTL